MGNGARVLVERALAAAGDDRVTLAFDRFLAHYGDHLLDHTGPYAGIPALLEGLTAAGATFSLVSNKPEGMCRAILAGLGWAARFGAVVGGDSLPSRKPDPAGVTWVRAQHGASSRRTLYVGDSVVDLETARAANVGFCGVAWGFAPQALRAAHPERMATHPADVFDFVVSAAGG